MKPVLFLSGEKNINAKLTAHDITLIRQLWPGLGYRSISVKFYVDYTTIRKIIKFKTWRHI